MANKLREEIKQSRPFSGLEEEALLNINRTAGYIQHAFQQLVKQYGLSEPQYNVLRILRGAGADGLRCMEIGERMVSHDPDVTRLLERLRSQGLIERGRDARDRRVIYSRITADGNKLLKELDPEVQKACKALLGHMDGGKLGTLIDLLEEVRQPQLA